MHSTVVHISTQINQDQQESLLLLLLIFILVFWCKYLLYSSVQNILHMCERSVLQHQTWEWIGARGWCYCWLHQASPVYQVQVILLVSKLYSPGYISVLTVKIFCTVYLIILFSHYCHKSHVSQLYLMVTIFACILVKIYHSVGLHLILELFLFYRTCFWWSKTSFQALWALHQVWGQPNNNALIWVAKLTWACLMALRGCCKTLMGWCDVI